MSWEILKNALQTMEPATGANGFEGLVGVLLEDLTGDRFLLARSGDQHGMDGATRDKSIVMQCKRYSTATLSDADLTSDFFRAISDLPETDVYILTLSRGAAAQHERRVNELRKEKAVDIVIIDYAEDLPDLGVLCVSFWHRLARFPSLQSLTTGLANWALSEAATDQVRNRLEQIRTEIQSFAGSRNFLQKQARAWLLKRFGLQGECQELGRQKLSLLESVPRDAEKSLREWWSSGKKHALLSGQEGMGKTWCAARFADSIAEEGILVFWLESAQWQNCKTLSSLISTALSGLCEWHPEVLARLERKLKRSWAKGAIFILDGVNERQALEAAGALLQSLSLDGAPNFRFLFTSRPLYERGGSWLEGLSGISLIKLGPFSDEEFPAALSLQKPPVLLEEIPQALEKWARIPRYLATSVQLRQQFGSLTDISREMLLWADLLQRIRYDIQVRDKLGWVSEDDAAQVLSQLAKKASFSTKDPELTREQLNDCFAGRFDNARSDLVEIRIAQNASVLKAQPSPDHVKLGTALYLLNIALQSEGNVLQIAEALLQALEPLEATDDRIESIFVALQMSKITRLVDPESSRNPRAALLLVWSNGQNSERVRERLQFWAEEDIEAYARFTDLFFHSLRPGAEQHEVVDPIGRVWLQGGHKAEDLKPHIRRWMLLIWKEGEHGDFLPYHNHELPLAQTHQQLRLSSVAVSLISLKPDSCWLEDIALCYGTLKLSKVKHRHQQGEVEKEFEIGIKDLEHPIGLLMRWNYTERCLPQLEQLAQTFQNDPVIRDGLQWLAKSLQMKKLPPPLRLPPKDVNDWQTRNALSLIRNNGALFLEDGKETFWSDEQISPLAVRNDLPPLREQDTTKLRELVDGICRQFLPHENQSSRSEDWQVDAWWPWYAKLFPKRFSELVTNLYKKSLTHTNPTFALLNLGGLVPDLNLIPPQELNHLIQKSARDRLLDKDGTPSFFLLKIWQIAILCLCGDELVEWLNFAANYHPLRAAIDWNSNPKLLGLVATEHVINLAFANCIEYVDAAPEEGRHSATKFDYWSTIAACRRRPDPDRYSWARDKLRSRTLQRNERFVWFRLIFATVPQGQFEEEFGNGRWPEILQHEGLLAAHHAGYEFGNLAPSKVAYEDLIRWMPRSMAGKFFAATRREDDFARWRNELRAFALCQVSIAPLQTTFRGKSTMVRNAQGLIISASFEYEYQQSSWSYSAPTIWGIDMQGGTFSLKNKLKADDWDEHRSQWHDDWDKLQTWDGYDLTTFEAPVTVKAWRQRFPEEFLTFAMMFLKKVAQEPASNLHIGGFTDTILCNLFSLAPTEALTFANQLNKLPLHISNDFGVTSFISALWNLGDCRSREHELLREKLFRDARTDAEILSLVLAALSEDSTAELWRLTKKFLADGSPAKDRALAVSIMAWLGTEAAVQELERLIASDESQWVSAHAEWALETTKGEKNCREFYRECLSEKNPINLSTKLQVLEPALSPLAIWWRKEVERSVETLFTTGPAAAIRFNFWNNWNPRHSNKRSFYGRNLNSYCRGEELGKPNPPRLAPWWSPHSNIKGSILTCHTS